LRSLLLLVVFVAVADGGVGGVGSQGDGDGDGDGVRPQTDRLSVAAPPPSQFCCCVRWTRLRSGSEKDGESSRFSQLLSMFTTLVSFPEKGE